MLALERSKPNWLHHEACLRSLHTTIVLAGGFSSGMAPPERTRADQTLVLAPS